MRPLNGLPGPLLLLPGGALVIGRKEGLGPDDREGFEPWPGAPCVFRHVAPGAKPG